MSDASSGLPVCGVVGLGAMGMGIARSLKRAGLEVVGCDVSAASRKTFEDEGGQCVAEASALAARCDVILLVVVNADQVMSVLFGDGKDKDDGLATQLAAGSLVIQCATVAPSVAETLGQRLDQAGLLMLDAPISGGAAKAATGELSVMASGTPQAFAKAARVLDAMAATVHHLGDVPGPGSSVKLVNQHLAGVHIAAAAEAMALGLRMGIDGRALYRVITQSAGNSWMFENRVPHILDGDYRPLSAVDIFVKDLNIVHDTGRELRLAMPVASSALQQFTAASGMGLGREDDSAVVKVYAATGGVALPAANDESAQ
ncbi:MULTISPECIES: L-threonate dehydrogenase [unclassified Halomonas]|uniref:L-threonate dehydrogenase n=1 Tax=unclassified Halomonas TaxID=2609666 RepID=UPI001C95651B|nr:MULTISPECIES: L-threonate dehydrogenase [unclassified Halomonas]MBY5924698.1 NAD(P)-dependent oxidoreductase [Halomonas sp. DP4Y7-2]MBY6231740.1 NAD(P)-dependent oxidoreductase [Halomonas sp. DP4Y7-1]